MYGLISGYLSKHVTVQSKLNSYVAGVALTRIPSTPAVRLPRFLYASRSKYARLTEQLPQNQQWKKMLWRMCLVIVRPHSEAPINIMEIT